MARPREQLYDPFVITYCGEYYGVATVKAVMDGIAFYELKDTTAAREAQQAMLGLEQPKRDLFFDYAYPYEPHGELGGDFIFLQGLQPHLCRFAMMDACGKGIRAAQMVLVLGAYFRSCFAI